MVYAVVSSLLTLSVIANGALYYLLRQYKTQKLDYGAQQLLRDLLSGDAVVRITPINRDEIFLRSPRDIR